MQIDPTNVVNFEKLIKEICEKKPKITKLVIVVDGSLLKNAMYQDLANSEFETLKSGFSTLIRKAKDYGIELTFVPALETTGARKTPEYKESVAKFNKYIKDNGGKLVPLNDLTLAGTSGINPDFANMGIRLSKEGAQKLAPLLTSVVLEGKEPPKSEERKETPKKELPKSTVELAF